MNKILEISTLLLTSKTLLEIPTKAYFDTLSENNRNRRDVSTMFNDQDNEFDNNKLTSLDSFTFNGSPTQDNEISKKNMSMSHSGIILFSEIIKQYNNISKLVLEA